VFCRITQLGLLRLLTNQAVMGDSVLNVGRAAGTLDRWSEDPRVEFAAEPLGIESAFRRSLRPFTNLFATRTIMDVYLAAFAEMEHATLVTLDRGLARIAQRTKVPHVVLRSGPRTQPSARNAR
jgi:predicted nucleic acid-binding protein